MIMLAVSVPYALLDGDIHNALEMMGTPDWECSDTSHYLDFFSVEALERDTLSNLFAEYVSGCHISEPYQSLHELYMHPSISDYEEFIIRTVLPAILNLGGYEIIDAIKCKPDLDEYTLYYDTLNYTDDSIQIVFKGEIEPVLESY